MRDDEGEVPRRTVGDLMREGPGTRGLHGDPPIPLVVERAAW